MKISFWQFQRPASEIICTSTKIIAQITFFEKGKTKSLLITYHADIEGGVGGRSIALLIFNLGFRCKWVPGLLPWYPFYRSLAEPQGWCGWVSITENLFLQLGVDRRTLQGVANLYTDYIILGLMS